MISNLARIAPHAAVAAAGARTITTDPAPRPTPLLQSASSAAKGSLYNRHGSAAMNTQTLRVRRTNSCVPIMVDSQAAARDYIQRIIMPPSARRLLQAVAMPRPISTSLPRHIHSGRAPPAMHLSLHQLRSLIGGHGVDAHRHLRGVRSCQRCAKRLGDTSPERASSVLQGVVVSFFHMAFPLRVSGLIK